MTIRRIGQGRENAKTFLRQNVDMAAKIEATIRQKLRPDRRKDPRGRSRETGRRGPATE